MARPPRDVTEAEMAILRVLWEERTATVRRLIDRLYPAGAAAHATVQKLLERLEAKGCIRRDLSGPVQVIIPAIPREVLVRRRLRNVADNLCGGSLSAMLSCLVNPRKLATKDRTPFASSSNNSKTKRRSEAPGTSPGSERKRAVACHGLPRGNGPEQCPDRGGPAPIVLVVERLARRPAWRTGSGSSS